MKCKGRTSNKLVRPWGNIFKEGKEYIYLAFRSHWSVVEQSSFLLSFKYNATNRYISIPRMMFLLHTICSRLLSVPLNTPSNLCKFLVSVYIWVFNVWWYHKLFLISGWTVSLFNLWYLSNKSSYLTWLYIIINHDALSYRTKISKLATK